MLAETPRGLGGLVLVARDGGLAARDTKALAPASDIGGIGRSMRAPATGRMIMPGPARRHIDFEGDLAAQALALCNPHGCRCFCHLRLPCLSSLRAQPRSLRHFVIAGLIGIADLLATITTIKGRAVIVGAVMT